MDTHQKYRPRARWFVIGVVLIVLAVVVFVGGLFLVLRPLTQEDGIVAANAGPVVIDVPAGEERALFTLYGVTSDCTITDSDGQRRPVEPVDGEFTYNDYVATGTFDTGSGDVSIECRSNSDVRVAQVPSTGAFVGGLVVAILGPIALGLAGFATLVVTGILYAVRPARPRPGS